MNRPLAPSASFTFNDEVGTGTLPDDAGFACLLDADGRRLCLRLPTNQTSRSTFRVTAATPTTSAATCFASSDPHI